MRLKIRSKLLFLSLFLIIFSFVIQMFFNILFLDSYYQYKRKEQVINIASQLVLNDHTPDELKQISNRYSLAIDYIPAKNINRVEENIIFENVDGVIKGRVSKKVEEVEENKFYPSEHMGVNFLTYYKKKGDDGFYILKTNMEEINQAVEISNNFVIYSTSIAIVFGVILSFIFSKFFLNPIYKINSKLQSLAKLDFGDKLFLNTNDEFQELSENINFVSNELENKMQYLKIANIKLKEDINREKYFKQQSKEFISSVTHEIKTPITIINTYAESLAEGYVNDEEKRKTYAEIIMEEGENITKLVNDLLKIIKDEYDFNTLNISTFDILEIMKDKLNKFKIDLEQKEVIYNINTLAKKIFVRADKEKIEHVIDNFLSNAVSYVEEKGFLNINIINESEVYLVEVENSGKHIAEENLEEVWKPFFKEDKSRNRKYGGTGLGLSIVSETLKNHKQRYGVVNTEKGVKFWFELQKAEEKLALKNSKKNII